MRFIPEGVSSSPLNETLVELVAWGHHVPNPAVLPLPACLREVGSWLRYAGDEGWRRALSSLDRELSESAGTVGPQFLASVEPSLTGFTRSFGSLDGSSTSRSRSSLAEQGDALLATMLAPAARVAAWRDLTLVVTAGGGVLEARSRRDLLHSILTHSGHDTGWPGLGLVGVLHDRFWDVMRARHGDDPTWDVSEDGRESFGLSESERWALCEELIRTSPQTGRCVVWVAFREARLSSLYQRVGSIYLLDARWAVPNAGAGGQDFPHRDELGNSAMRVPTEDALDPDIAMILARVDLGHRAVAGATDAAADLVRTVVDSIAFRHSGQRWKEYGWQALIVDGTPIQLHDFDPEDAGPLNSIFDLQRTAEGLAEQGAPLASALVRAPLSAEVDEALRCVIEAETAPPKSQVVLFARAVEMIAAADGTGRSVGELMASTHASKSLSAEIVSGVNRALSADRQRSRDLHLSLHTTIGPGVFQVSFVGVASALDELKHLASDLPDAVHVREILDWLVDPERGSSAFQRFERDAELLLARHRRVRNALTHGNPVTAEAIRSVAPFSGLLGRQAVSIALDAHAAGSSAANALHEHSTSVGRVTAHLRRGSSFLDAISWEG